MRRLQIETAGQEVALAYNVPGFGPMFVSASAELRRTLEQLVERTRKTGLPLRGWLFRRNNGQEDKPELESDARELTETFEHLLQGTPETAMPLLRWAVEKEVGHQCKPGDECFIEALAEFLARCHWHVYLQEVEPV